jgi:Family of unknown function (DUF6328)
VADSSNEQRERGSGRDESEAERLDRNLGELLQELRVALPGVQVLFAFLLAVPFQQEFNKISDLQKDLYFATLMLTALTAALLIAPTAYHRLTFRYQQKHRLVFVANRLAIAGLGTMAAAMICAIALITSVIFSTAAAIVTSAIAILVFLWLWVVLPLKRRLKYRDEGLPLLDPPEKE